MNSNISVSSSGDECEMICLNGGCSRWGRKSIGMIRRVKLYGRREDETFYE